MGSAFRKGRRHTAKGASRHTRAVDRGEGVGDGLILGNSCCAARRCCFAGRPVSVCSGAGRFAGSTHGPSGTGRLQGPCTRRCDASVSAVLFVGGGGVVVVIAKHSV